MRIEGRGGATGAGVESVEGVEGDEASGACRMEGKDWLSGKTELTEKEIGSKPRRV